MPLLGNPSEIAESYDQLYKHKCIEVLQLTSEVNRLQRSLAELNVRSACRSQHSSSSSQPNTDLLRHLNNQLNIKDRQLVEKDTIIKNLMDTQKSLQPNEKQLLISESMPDVNQSSSGGSSLRISRSLYKNSLADMGEAMKRVKLGMIRVITTNDPNHTANSRISAIDPQSQTKLGGVRNNTVRKSAIFASQRQSTDHSVKKNPNNELKNPCKSAFSKLAKERIALEKKIAELMRCRALKDTNEALRSEVARLTPFEDEIKYLRSKINQQSAENDELLHALQANESVIKIDNAVQTIESNEMSEKNATIANLTESLTKSQDKIKELTAVLAEFGQRECETKSLIRQRDELEKALKAANVQLTTLKNSYEKRLVNLVDDRNDLQKQIETDFVPKHVFDKIKDELGSIDFERQNLVKKSELQNSKLDQLAKLNEFNEKTIGELRRELRAIHHHHQETKPITESNDDDNERVKQDMKSLMMEMASRDEKIRILENESVLASQLKAKLSLTEWENRNLKNALFEMRKQLEAELGMVKRRPSCSSLNKHCQVGEVSEIGTNNANEVMSLKVKVKRLEHKAEALLLSRDEMMNEIANLRRSEKRRSYHTIPVGRFRRFSRNGFNASSRIRSYSHNPRSNCESNYAQSETEISRDMDERRRSDVIQTPTKSQPIDNSKKEMVNAVSRNDRGCQTMDKEPVLHVAIALRSTSKPTDSRLVRLEKGKSYLLVGFPTSDGFYMAYNHQGKQGLAPARFLKIVHDINLTDRCFWAADSSAINEKVESQLTSVPKPTNLTINKDNNNTSKSIRISWLAPRGLRIEDIFEYELIVDDVSIRNLGRSETSTVVSDVSFDKPHRISLRLKSIYGISKPHQCTLMFGEGATMKPDRITLKYLEPDSVTVSWIPGSSSIDHLIFLNDKHLCTIPAGTCKFKLTGLHDDRQYNLVIQPGATTNTSSSSSLNFDLRSVRSQETTPRSIQKTDSSNKPQLIHRSISGSSARSLSQSTSSPRTRIDSTNKKQQISSTSHHQFRLFVALYDYQPLEMSPNLESCHEELAFREGQLIKIHGDIGPDGFYIGEIAGQRGYVPSNMVDEVKASDPDVWMHLMSEYNRYEKMEIANRLRIPSELAELTSRPTKNRTATSRESSLDKSLNNPVITTLKPIKPPTTPTTVQRCVSSQEIRDIAPVNQKPNLHKNNQPSSLPNISRETAKQTPQARNQIGSVAWISSQMPKWNIFDKIKERIPTWDNTNTNVEQHKS